MRFVMNGWRVGISSCKDCADGQPYMSKAKTIEEMVENVQRLDVADRIHTGISPIYLCPTCIL